MQYTMDAFWIPRLSTTVRAQSQITGWSHVDEGLETFLEASLTIGSGFGQSDPHNSNILLVSAPGAVGKTTLARQIASRTGAMLVDLAEAAAVGAGTMTGGLAKTGLYNKFLKGEASVIVDGLDEARIRVTQEGFSAFIEDLVDLVSSREKMVRKPVVLFGRTGAVDESWLLLSEHNVEPPVLEIDYFDLDRAQLFAEIQARHIRNRNHEPDKRAIELLLGQLQNQTLADGTSFIGYSPVLVAVAKRIADPKDQDYEKNTAQLISRLEKGKEQITLAGIANSILEREQKKIRTLGLSDSELNNKLYTPDEQFARLVDRVYGQGLKYTLPAMSPTDREAYENALKTWVNEHPFLDGVGRNSSSAVFGGIIAAKALGIKSISDEVLLKELNLNAPINPFLAEFYITDLKKEQETETPYIPSEHIGLVYASLCARLASGQNASLRIDAEPVGFDVEDAEVEISVEGSTSVPIAFKTSQDGQFKFGRKVQDISIVAPTAELVIGGGTELTLIAPVSVEVANLILDGDQITVEQPAHRAREEIKDVVDIRARQEMLSQVLALPRHAGEVKLEVNWPGSEKWPWGAFSVEEEDEEDPRIYDGINALLRIIRLFKSKGKGNLAKFCGAIDHHRRTYGLGQAVRDQLLREEILSRKEPFYFLDPDRLMTRAGLMYNTVRAGVANDATREFIRRALENMDNQ